MCETHDGQSEPGQRREGGGELELGHSAGLSELAMRPSDQGEGKQDEGTYEHLGLIVFTWERNDLRVSGRSDGELAQRGVRRQWVELTEEHDLILRSSTRLA